MSAKIAEALAKVAELHNNLGEAYTELSALYDAESAKGGKSGGDGAAGKVSGKGDKAAVGSKGSKAAAVVDDDDEDLPPPKAAGKAKPKAKAKAVTEDDVRAAAKKVIDKHGKDKAVEILGGKLADVEEDDYAEVLAKLEAALEDGDGDDDI